MDNQAIQIRAGYVSAVAAALAASAFRFLSMKLHLGILPLEFIVRTSLLALISYLLVSYLMSRLTYVSQKRYVPIWLVICVVGSAMFTVVDLAPDLIDYWYSRQREWSLVSSTFMELGFIVRLAMKLSLVTLPIAALSFAIVQSILRSRLERAHTP